MAVLAELQPTLYEPQFDIGYSFVDQSPLLAGVRAAARSEAYEIIEQQRTQIRNANYASVSLDVDPLSSAQAVIEQRTIYGETSPAAEERFMGLQLDCARLLGEAARAKTYEYFEPMLQTLDPVSGDYFSNGYSLNKITQDGLSPVAVPEELERRVNERVEEVTYRAIGQLAVLGLNLQPEEVSSEPRRIRTISECPDWAHEALANGRNTGGYVPEINKFIIRDVTFNADGSRHEEQMALPGNLIDAHVIRDLLEAEGLAARQLSKLELQSRQFEVTDSLLDFVAKLDVIASQKLQQPIFMGEPAAESATNIIYQQIPAEAALRRDAMAQQATELAETLISLEQIGTDHHAANGLVANLVQQMLLDVAEADPEQATFSFNKEVVANFKAARVLHQQGRHDEAIALVAETKASAPPVSYCGAGSCGLEKGDVVGDKAKVMKEMGLETSGSLKDTERACPKCHKKEVVYDLKNKVKACTNCKSKTGFGRK